MNPTRLHFQQGDPLPAGNINSLVGSSVELQEGVVHEHSGDGLHLDVRLEFASGVFERDGSAWRLAFGDRIDYQGYNQSSNFLFGVVIEEFASIVSAANAAGLVAFDDLGRAVPYQGLIPGYPGEAEFLLMPPSGANMIFVTVIARREVGG